MVNTIRKEVFLIMCSQLNENTRYSGCFLFELRITVDYTLPILCGAPHNIGNEEAKLIGMEGNRRFGESIYAGPIFVTRDNGVGGICSLTDEQVQKYSEMFAEPHDISPEEVQSDMGYTLFGWDW